MGLVGIHIRACSEVLAQTINQAIFHTQCRKVQALQRTVLGGDINAKTLLGRKP